LEWTDAGIEGAWRYSNRLWRLAADAQSISDGALPEEMDSKVTAVVRQIHRTIATVSDDIEKFRFNSAVARIRELTNALANLDQSLVGGDIAFRLGIKTTAQLINPLMPHVAEEIWQSLGEKTILAEVPWPEFDPALLSEDTVTIAVQVNGKLRGTITVATDTDNAACEAAALAIPAVQKQLGGQAPRKVIVVPKKIVNIVAA
jgi:leucyl-tRNA synthetase